MSDFLVIGGGIAGLSAAAALAALGSVTVLEAEEALGYHASGRSMAMYPPNYGNRVVRALTAASREGLADVLSPRGILTVGTSDQRALVDQACADGGTGRLTFDEARDMAPILNPQTCAHIAWTPDAAEIDTDRLMQGYRRALTGAGGAIHLRARVTGITRRDGKWRLVTERGDTHTAAVLVNAAGAWADQVAALAGVAPVGLTPCRRSVARMPVPGGADASGWPFLLGAAEDWYAKPDAGRWVVSSAEQTPCEPHDAWADDMALAEGIARYEAMVTEAVTRVEHTWGGLRTFAPDRTLVLGPDPDAPSFIWCAGQGGYGFQTAPAASATLAAIVGGTDAPVGSADLAALGPDRLRA